MPSRQIDIKKLISSSIRIFNDCMLPNGCFVAAPAHMPYYPKDAKSYLYSWPGRDMGFSLAAMILIGKDYYEPTLKWLWERAEDFQFSNEPQYKGLIFRSYHPNGLIHEHQFQPDQGATLLWSIGFKHKLTKKTLTKLETKVVNQLAQNYMRIWNKSGFTVETEDLWEERGLMPQEGHFTYSLSACSKGLETAYELLGDTSFQKTSKEMKNAIKKYCFNCTENTIPRQFGGSLGTDTTVDGALSGLVWPFNIGFPKKHLEATINKIEKDLTSNWGVFRYPKDRYEGADSHNHTNDRAGAWPLLTFWLSIANTELGNKDKAKKFFNLGFSKLEDLYCIPEQIFCCSSTPWTGVKPLFWSHAKAIIAAWKLKLLSTTTS